MTDSYDKLFFRNTDNNLGTNSGTGSQDIVWFAIRNVDSIDMGTKSLNTCLKNVMVGTMDPTDKDLTGCVGHARNVDWRNLSGFRSYHGN